MDTFKIVDWFKKYHPTIFLSVPIIFGILGLSNFEIGKEAYFYTLSTVAQSLAALIGIIGVFCIFRIDKLSSQRKDCLSLLYKRIGYFGGFGGVQQLRYSTTPFYPLINLFKIDSKEELLDEIIPVLEEINKIDEKSQHDELHIKELNKLVDSIKEIEKKDKQIRMMFNQPASFGLLAITISILILPFGWIGIPFVTSITIPK